MQVVRDGRQRFRLTVGLARREHARTRGVGCAEAVGIGPSLWSVPRCSLGGHSGGLPWVRHAQLSYAWLSQLFPLREAEAGALAGGSALCHTVAR